MQHPTELDIEEKINALRAEKTTATNNKKEIESRLTALRNLFRSSGLMPRDKYRQCLEVQNSHTQNLAAVEKSISRISNEIARLSTEKSRLVMERKNGASATTTPRTEEPTIEWKRGVVDELCKLRAFYQDFSADRDRISSKRQMAAEFANALNPIIKAFLRD